MDLKLAFLFLGQRKVKNQEDFLVVEVGQRNSGHSDEYRCKILKIYVQIFERFLDLILTFMTTKYFVLTTFSTPISLWFSRNSKLNIWCSTWHVNKVEGAKMRVMVNFTWNCLFYFWLVVKSKEPTGFFFGRSWSTKLCGTVNGNHLIMRHSDEKRWKILSLLLIPLY